MDQEKAIESGVRMARNILREAASGDNFELKSTRLAAANVAALNLLATFIFNELESGGGPEKKIIENITASLSGLVRDMRSAREAGYMEAIPLD